MRRFLVTNPSTFTGEAELLYDADGRLVRIDVTNTNMPPGTVGVFKERIPVQVADLPTVFASGRATLIEAAYEVTFEQFWSAYDKKVNRKRTEPLWNKLSKTDQVQAMQGVQAYTKYLKREAWRSKADPEKYLRDRYWENEYK